MAKHVTVTNSEKGSQLLIPSSERSDTGIYTILVKNVVGQDTFDIEIRVTGNINWHALVAHFISIFCGLKSTNFLRCNQNILLNSPHDTNCSTCINCMA